MTEQSTTTTASTSKWAKNYRGDDRLESQRYILQTTKTTARSIGLLFLFPLLSLLLLLHDNSTILVSAQDDNDNNVPMNNIILELNHVFTRLGDDINDDDMINQKRTKVTTTSFDGLVVAIGWILVDNNGNCNEDSGGSKGLVVIWVYDILAGILHSLLA